ncbi:MAG: MASE3 domain-containing protein [Desulfobacteraceae bacterium]
MEEKSFTSVHLGVYALFGLALAGLYLISLDNYLLYHSIAETFSIFVAFGVFAVSINTPEKDKTFSFFTIIGTGLVFTGGLDFLHMQSYKGMGVFQEHGTNTAVQLWIAARSLETLTFLAAIFFLNRRIHRKIIYWTFFFLFSSLVAAVFFSGIFPVCFVEGQGLTFFKKTSEYILCSVLVVCLILLKQRSGILPRSVEKLLAGAIALTIASEICFVLYLNPYGTFNFLGHLFKIVSFFLLYKAVVEKNVVLPRSEIKKKLTEQDKKLEAEAALNHVLAELARKIIAAKSIEDVSGFVLEQAKIFTESSFGFAGYIDRETGCLVSPTLTETVWDKCRVQEKDHIFSKFSGLWGWVLKNREPLCTNEVASDPRSTGVPPGHVSIDSFLSVPALIGGKLVGQIALANSARAYEKKDISDLEKIAHLYAISINEKQRINEMQQAKQEAEAANELKTLFLANMSHEIRTPLNAVTGFAQLLRDSLQGLLTPRQKNYVVHIIEAGNRLTELVNDILDISRIESGETRIKAAPFSVQDLIRKIEGVLLGLNHDNRLNCHVQADDSLPETLVGDQDRIMQVLTNFISNAVKFTREGSIIVSVEKSADEKTMFKVSDTGIGLPEEVHTRLFDKFYQVDSSYTRQYQGAGLGLSISKELVELMGGSIGVESQPGTGSAFYFVLDLPAGCLNSPDSVHKAALPEPPPSVHPGLKILLADDDELSRKAMARFLESSGHTVTGAENGREVLKALETDSFDIILMDVQMPEMDGVEATKTIRNVTSDRFDSDIPIIALTAYAMAGDREQLIKTGMTDYLSKPVDFNSLNRTINKVMGGLSPPIEPEAPKRGDDACNDEDIADIQAFLKTNSDDPGFTGEILNAFPQHVFQRLARLETVVEDRDLKEISAAAHKFTALFSAVYIRAACQISQELQAAARQEDPALCHRLFQDLKSRMHGIVQYINTVRQRD